MIPYNSTAVLLTALIRFATQWLSSKVPAVLLLPGDPERKKPTLESLYAAFKHGVPGGAGRLILVNLIAQHGHSWGSFAKKNLGVSHSEVTYWRVTSSAGRNTPSRMRLKTLHLNSV